MTTIAEQRDTWARRVRQMGVTRAPFHVKQRVEDLEAVTEAQWAIIRPFLQQALTDLKDPQTPPLRAHCLHVLDYGCAWGRMTERLAALSKDYSVTGVDIVHESIRQATINRRTMQTGYELLTEEGRIPLAMGSVDCVFSWTVLSAITDDPLLELALDEWQRVLKPGGLVALLDNTSKVDGRAVRSPYSISRTVEEYQRLFAGWCPLTPVTDLIDLGEVNTFFLGRVPQ